MDLRGTSNIGDDLRHHSAMVPKRLVQELTAKRSIYDCIEGTSLYQNCSQDSMDEFYQIFDGHIQPDIQQNYEALKREIGNTANEENAYSCSPSTQTKFPPLGLKLTITPELCAHAGRVVSGRALTGFGGKPDNSISERGTTGSLVTQDKPDKKFNSVSFNIKSINIGNWQVDAKQQNDLVGKFYYSNKAIIWEILAGRCKKKLEIKFDHIIAIKATFRHNETGILQILLKEAPDFKEEAPAQAWRKKTIWRTCSDFTGCQALIYRTHTVTCSVGALEKHYEMLLQSDGRLLELSRKPFPRDYHPMFPPTAPVNLRTPSQYNSFGGSHVNPLVLERLHDPYGFDPPPPATGFLPNNGNFINGALNWNNNQQNISFVNVPQGQDNSIQGYQGPNYAYVSEAGINYQNMVPLTCLDNMMTASEPTGDVFDDVDGKSTFGSN